MITGNIKSQIDQIWNAFWSGGIANPLEAIEQITYLLFLRRLDDMHTLEESKAARARRGRWNGASSRRALTPRAASYDDLRWSRFKHFAPAEMFAVRERARLSVPAGRTGTQSGGDDSTYAHHMKDARFTIPTAGPAGQGGGHARRACRWKTATPRATSTSTCSARSPAPGRTASSARRATSSQLMVELTAPHARRT
jgi:hypothetical protein